MISNEDSSEPDYLDFDVAIVAVGYESRCRWVVENKRISARTKIGLEFGFLKEASYHENCIFFEANGWKIFQVGTPEALTAINDGLRNSDHAKPIRVFVDISSMSREMMAGVVLALNPIRSSSPIEITAAYAPSAFSGPYLASPIRQAEPVKPGLAGWSSRPDKPLGVIMGLGCEPGLALGALQVLEPSKAWLHSPRGFEEEFTAATNQANEHISDIFDVTMFEYDLKEPVVLRGRIEALINSVGENFRLICIPFGPKIYAWLALLTIVFGDRRHIGVWTFSSKDHAVAIDRKVSGNIVWHSALCV